MILQISNFFCDPLNVVNSINKGISYSIDYDVNYMIVCICMQSNLRVVNIHQIICVCYPRIRITQKLQVLDTSVLLLNKIQVSPKRFFPLQTPLLLSLFHHCSESLHYIFYVRITTFYGAKQG